MAGLTRYKELQEIARTEGLAVAWLLQMTENWTCEECDNIVCTCADSSDDEDMPLAALSETLQAFYLMCGEHRSTVRIVKALGGKARKSTEGASCLKCGEPWPCRIISELETSSKTMLDEWAKEMWLEAKSEKRAAV